MREFLNPPKMLEGPVYVSDGASVVSEGSEEEHGAAAVRLPSGTMVFVPEGDTHLGPDGILIVHFPSNQRQQTATRGAIRALGWRWE